MNVLQEKADNLDVVIHRSQSQSFIIVCVNVCAILQEKAHNLEVAIARSLSQSFIIVCTNVGTVLEEKVNDIDVAIFRSQLLEHDRQPRERLHRSPQEGDRQGGHSRQPIAEPNYYSCERRHHSPEECV